MLFGNGKRSIFSQMDSTSLVNYEARPSVENMVRREVEEKKNGQVEMKREE